MKRYKIYRDENVPKNLPLMLKKTVSEVGNLNIQAYKSSKKGDFNYVTYSEFYDEVLAFALALKKLGVKKNDNVGLISDNRKEWLITDNALLALGAADVPRGCDSTGKEIRYILDFADCTLSFFENEKQISKVLENIENAKKLKDAIIFDEVSKDTVQNAKAKGITIHSFGNLEKESIEYAKNHPEEIKAIENEMESIEPDTNATIIFTSGTTGTPKGVMLTHENFLAQIRVVKNVLPCKPGDWWLSVLPVWHSFERVVQYFAIYLKCGIAYSKPIASIMLPDFAKIRPQYICGVPRLWEALSSGITRTMKKQGGIKYAMFRFFFNIGGKYTWAKEHVTGKVCRLKNYPRIFDFMTGIIPFLLLWGWAKIGDILIFSKIREKLGGRLQMAVAGGGALQPEIDLFYRTARIRILEGYGMTESAPVLSFRNWRRARSGCVGEIYPSVEIKIVEEKDNQIIDGTPLAPGKQGLILARGPQIMKGYYKRKDLTNAAIDSDGWLNTGDLGVLTFDGELKISGRAKDTIVLLDGENIEPLSIESAICSSEYIENAVLFGQDKKYLASLIVPHKESIENYAKDNGLTIASYEELLETHEIQSLIHSEIEERVNIQKGFRICEKIYKFKTIPTSFTVGNELSAKQEIIRPKILRKYNREVEELFKD